MTIPDWVRNLWDKLLYKAQESIVAGAGAVAIPISIVINWFKKLKS